MLCCVLRVVVIALYYITCHMPYITHYTSITGTSDERVCCDCIAKSFEQNKSLTLEKNP